MVKRSYPEDALQQASIEYIRLQYPHVLAFHVPNGGKRNLYEATRLKRQGVVPGIADILIFWQGGHGAIELKCGRNKTSPHQDYFADKWQWTGGRYALCRDLDSVVAALKDWGVK